jgi:hypothetical protein
VRHDQLTNATLAAWTGEQKPRYGSDAGLLIRSRIRAIEASRAPAGQPQ